MRNNLLLVLYLAIIPIFSQFTSTCQWGDFSLQGAQGYEIQCVDGDFAYGYTPCMQYALCNGARYQAVYFNRNNGQCQYYLAQWDSGETIPQYSSKDNIAEWTFYYANGQTTPECPQGIQFDIVWTCCESCVPFSLSTTCEQISECKHTMGIRSVYACVEEPPPDNKCVWGNVDLRGTMGYEISCIDGFNEQFAYLYTPCMEYSLCYGQRYQAVRFDRQSVECQYYLSQWDNGITAPSYFNDEGNPSWQFNYKNGQITAQCLDGIEFTVNWICDELCVPFCLATTCSQVNECRYQMAVRSVYACVTPADNQRNVFFSEV
eukprot:217555_1